MLMKPITFKDFASFLVCNVISLTIVLSIVCGGRAHAESPE